jgi:hypothetical protein
VNSSETLSSFAVGCHSPGVAGWASYSTGGASPIPGWSFGQDAMSMFPAAPFAPDQSVTSPTVNTHAIVGTGPALGPGIYFFGYDVVDRDYTLAVTDWEAGGSGLQSANWSQPICDDISAPRGDGPVHMLVPEPGTAVLALTGIGGLLAARLRRKARVP